MTIAQIPVLAAIALANGVTTAPTYEQICNRVLMLQVSPLDIPRTVTPADINGVAAAFVVAGATTPWWLEQIGNIVLTYPYVRVDASVTTPTFMADGIDRMGF